MLDIPGSRVKKYKMTGYIFNKNENKIIISGKMTERPYRNRLFDYDLKIVNELDPVAQT